MMPLDLPKKNGNRMVQGRGTRAQMKTQSLIAFSAAPELSHDRVSSSPNNQSSEDSGNNLSWLLNKTSIKSRTE